MNYTVIIAVKCLTVVNLSLKCNSFPTVELKQVMPSIPELLLSPNLGKTSVIGSFVSHCCVL